MYIIQNYLRSGGTIDELKNKFAIDATRHKTYNNLILLKYNQIESPFAESMVCEARGIILDEADDWRVICTRFSKFFNHGEGHAAPIDWKTARVQEKVDGSLTTPYFYDNKWHVATSGSPDASGEVNGFPFTFAELFWKTFEEMKLSLPNNTDLCPSFELTSPFNRVVIPHKTASLTLIGIFDRVTGNEFVDHKTTYPVVKSYAFNSLGDVVSYAKTLNGIEQEGFVVVDGNFNRVKIKGDQYVALHHLKDSWGPRRIVEIVRVGEIAEVCAYFPEYADQFNDTKARYDRLVQNLNDTYDKLKSLTVQKDFALAVQAHKCSVPGALYSLRAGKVISVQQFLADMPVRSLMMALGLKDINS